jgi:hypothetical protein
MANSEVTEEKVGLKERGGGGEEEEDEATTSLMETATSQTHPHPPKRNGCGWRHLHNITYLWPSMSQHCGK